MEWASLATGIDDEKRTATIYGNPEVPYHLTATAEYSIPHHHTPHFPNFNLQARVPIEWR
jgi:hypothetical protein